MLSPLQVNKSFLSAGNLKPITASLQGSQVFGPNHRLHYSWEYREFFNQSAVARLSQCTIFRIGNSSGTFRLGITLKARGSSVDRNKVKRQIREAFRTQAGTLGSYDYNVVIAANKRMSYPYPNKLGVCLRNELSNAVFKTLSK